MLLRHSVRTIHCGRPKYPPPNHIIRVTDVERLEPLVVIQCRRPPSGIVNEHDSAAFAKNLELVLSHDDGRAFIETDAKQCFAVNAVVHLRARVGENLYQIEFTCSGEEMLVNRRILDKPEPVLMVADEDFRTARVAPHEK